MCDNRWRSLPYAKAMGSISKIPHLTQQLQRLAIQDKGRKILEIKNKLLTLRLALALPHILSPVTIVPPVGTEVTFYFCNPAAAKWQL